MLSEYIKKLNTNHEVYLQLKILPNAAKNAVKEIMSDNTIKLHIAAVPEKGKANKELTLFLAKTFRVAKDDVKIISGVSAKTKLVKIIKN